MDRAKLKAFVGQIVDINPKFPIFTNFSAAVTGMTTAQQTMVNDLKKATLALASEASKKAPDQSVLEGLFKEVQGGIEGLCWLKVIDKTTLAKLLDELDTVKILN